MHFAFSSKRGSSVSQGYNVCFFNTSKIQHNHKIVKENIKSWLFERLNVINSFIINAAVIHHYLPLHFPPQSSSVLMCWTWRKTPENTLWEFSTRPSVCCGRFGTPCWWSCQLTPTSGPLGGSVCPSPDWLMGGTSWCQSSTAGRSSFRCFFSLVWFHSICSDSNSDI